MAKSSRASTVKANNRRLKRNVFGPVEAARLERLSAKLLETAAQPKPATDDAEAMKIVDGKEEEEAVAAAEDGAAVETTSEDVAMDVETTKPSSKSNPKKRIEKRRKSSKVVFPSYKDKKTKTKRRS